MNCYLSSQVRNLNRQRGIRWESNFCGFNLANFLRLPDDIDWVISMDLGDVLVLDDILELWELQQHLKEHFFAVSYAAALGQHLNAGLVLYHLHQMRHGNFTDLILRAATWSMKVQEDGLCPRDQNILNVLKDQEFLSTVNIEEAKIMKILPCRWSLFPVVDWHPAWSKVELWQVEIFQRLRYPGVVSTSQVWLFMRRIQGS